MTDVADLSPPTTGKREQTKQQNRRAILDAARQVFGEMGYDVATVRDIIRRTNLSVGAFYNYYRSKEEVYEALSDDGARRFRPILQAQYEQADDFKSYIRGAITAYFNFIVIEDEAWRDKPALSERHPHVRTETPEMRAVFDQVRTSVTGFLERGSAPPVDAEYLAAACIAIAREVGDRMMSRRPVDVPAAVEFVVQMILGGLASLPRQEN